MEDENVDINFREINKDNYNICVSLKLTEYQSNFLTSNAFSLVQACYEDKLYPLGIYNGDEMVGFLLYDYDADLQAWSFSRFMIDMKHQNKGFGSRALENFLKFFHNKFPNEKLYTSVDIDNEIAINLYERYGFNKKNKHEYKIENTIYREFRMLKEAW